MTQSALEPQLAAQAVASAQAMEQRAESSHKMAQSDCPAHEASQVALSMQSKSHVMPGSQCGVQAREPSQRQRPSASRPCAHEGGTSSVSVSPSDPSAVVAVVVPVEVPIVVRDGPLVPESSYGRVL